MAGRATLTTVASSAAIPDPSTVATSTHRPTAVPKRTSLAAAVSDVMQAFVFVVVLVDDAVAGRAPPTRLERGAAGFVVRTRGRRVARVGAPVGEEPERAGQLPA